MLKGGTVTDVLFAFVTMIDFKPLDESETVTLICVGGPTIVCVNAHAGGVLSRTIELLTVIANVPLVVPITIDAGLYVGAAQAKPAIGAGATSVTEHEVPVGMPVTVAGVLVVTVREPVIAPFPQLKLTVYDVGTGALFGFDSTFLIVNVPRSRVIAFFTVIDAPFAVITTDAVDGV